MIEGVVMLAGARPGSTSTHRIRRKCANRVVFRRDMGREQAVIRDFRAANRAEACFTRSPNAVIPYMHAAILPVNHKRDI